MTLLNVLAPLDALLKRNHIEYAIIGGYAVAAWGEIRATRDVDLLCNAKRLNALKDALTEAGIHFEHRAGDFDDPISDVIQIELETADEPYEIDVLSGIRGAPAGILERSCLVQIESLSVPIASPEDIIVLKLLGGSARDIDDIRGIMRAQGGRLDLALLRRLCPEPHRELLENLVRAAE